MKDSKKMGENGSPAYGLRLAVLIPEFMAWFWIDGPGKPGPYLAGYGLLAAVIFRKNPGQEMLARYEQEAEVFLQCLLADSILGIFLWGSSMEGEAEALSFFIKLAGLFCLQVISLWGLCLFVRIWGRKKEKDPLYLWGEPKQEFSKREDRMKECEEIRLQNIPADHREELFRWCFRHKKSVAFSGNLSDLGLWSASLSQIGDTPVFLCHNDGIGRISRIIKRTFDITLSILLLGVFSPVFLLIALCIRAEDGREVFYRQTRCTREGKEFRILKFRSMVSGAEEQAGACLAQKGDQRLTRMGKILRRTKLDELPQLVNILTGQMSFVGPRPERPELIAEITKQIPEFVFRNRVKAGLTGYAQVHGGYHTEYSDKLRWDLLYIQNYSLLLDIKILLMTIPAVLRGSDDV